jgi:hypothetical protein
MDKALIQEAAVEAPTAVLLRAAFDAILDGRAPLLADLAGTTTVSPEEVDRLIGRGLIVDDSGRVVAAHGLSLVPARQHRLTLRGRMFWTWCAIDAVGIPAGLHEDAVAETTCEQCGTPVRLEFRGGNVVHASHPAAQVWEAARMDGRGAAGPPHCALMNLFCSAEHLADWRAAHPAAKGRARSPAEVGELGRAEWRAVPDEASCDDAECCP